MQNFQTYKIPLFGAALALSFLAAGTARAQMENIPSITLSAADYSETFSRDQVAGWLKLETSLAYQPGYASEIEHTAFCPTNRFFCNFTVSRTSRQALKVKLQSEFNEESVAKFVASFAEKVNQEPKDAVFSADSDGKIIVATPESVGRAVNEKEGLRIISEALQSNRGGTLALKLPTEVTQPEIRSSDKDRLGLKELIGEGKTNFKGSPKNRVYNINRSLQQFQNIIVPAGKEFSFVEYLGEVDGEHGYLPELVIKDNKTEPEFGGGVCQVSSTVFRAAIYSGMKITERRNHSYPVQYYKPYGLDATIYIPKPDFKFVNNTDHAIFMQATIVGTELTFRFFGTDDGRETKVDGPHILESNPDGSMKTVFTQTVLGKDGKEMIKDTFWSNYKSPSLFPHPGEEKKLTEKPKDWSNKQWSEYKRINP